MRRRRFLFLTGVGATGAAFGGGSVATRVFGSEEPPPDTEEIEDPRTGVQRIIWTVDTDQPVAALTFDDGPHPALTPRILEILDRHRVKATFMAMGWSARQYPGLVAEVLSAGHELGHHSWSHLNLAQANDEDTRRQIVGGARAVADVAGVRVRLFRPPRVRLSDTAIRLVASLQHEIIMYSVTRGALDERSPQRVADYVVDKVGPGHIIDLHDGIGRGTFHPGSALANELLERRLTEVQALPRMLERVSAKGIQLGTVSDLFATQAPTAAVV